MFYTAKENYSKYSHLPHNDGSVMAFMYDSSLQSLPPSDIIASLVCVNTPYAVCTMINVLNHTLLRMSPRWTVIQAVILGKHLFL